MTTYLSTMFEGGGDKETSIRNERVFDPAWPDLVGPTPESAKAMLQAEYITQTKRVNKLWIKLSTSYGLVISECNNYLWLRLKG